MAGESTDLRRLWGDKMHNWFFTNNLRNCLGIGVVKIPRFHSQSWKQSKAWSLPATMWRGLGTRTQPHKYRLGQAVVPVSTTSQQKLVQESKWSEKCCRYSMSLYISLGKWEKMSMLGSYRVCILASQGRMQFNLPLKYGLLRCLHMAPDVDHLSVSFSSPKW